MAWSTSMKKLGAAMLLAMCGCRLIYMVWERWHIYRKGSWPTFEIFSVQAYAIPFPDGNVFIQDRCSIHLSWVAIFLFKDWRNVNLLDWPRKGCDMNRTENIYGKIFWMCWILLDNFYSTHLMNGKWLGGSHDWCMTTLHWFQNSVIDGESGWKK